MSETTLEARIQRLEDIEALRKLKACYAEACDDDYNADAIAALFTEEAIWDGGPMGRYEGRQAIRDFFEVSDQIVPFAIHHVTNSILDVEGDRATGRWYLWQPCTFAQDGSGADADADAHAGSDAHGESGFLGSQGLWMAGTYRDVYRRQGDAWLFERVEITLRMLSPYEDGWARTPMIEVPI